MRGTSALAAVAAWAAQASGAPVANMTPDPGIVTRGDAPSATPFDVQRTAWDQPAQIDFVSARGAVVIEPDPRADAILVPTPGTAALAALAGLVIILPRKRP